MNPSESTIQRPCGNIIFLRPEDGLVMKQFSSNPRFKLKIDREKAFYQPDNGIRAKVCSSSVMVPLCKEIEIEFISLEFIEADEHEIGLHFGYKMIDAVTDMHAQLWGSSDLNNDMFDIEKELIEDFRVDFGDLMSNQSKLPESLFQKLVAVQEKSFPPSNHWTLVHGDYKIDNVILHSNNLYIIDWDVYHKNVGALDIVFLCLRWPIQSEIADLFLYYYRTVSDKLRFLTGIMYTKGDFEADVRYVLRNYCFIFVNSASNLVKDPVRLAMIHQNYEFMIDKFCSPL
jgi:hypothetical protein